MEAVTNLMYATRDKGYNYYSGAQRKCYSYIRNLTIKTDLWGGGLFVLDYLCDRAVVKQWYVNTSGSSNQGAQEHVPPRKITTFLVSQNKQLSVISYSAINKSKC